MSEALDRPGPDSRAHDEGVAIQPFLDGMPVAPGDDLGDADGLGIIMNDKTERCALE